MNTSSFVNGYTAQISQAVLSIEPTAIQCIVDALYSTYERDCQVFTFGNGASAALASHIACDLGKGTAADLGQGSTRSGARRLRIIGLADNMALLSAYGNDVGYDDVFVEQLKNLLRPGDTVIAISGSGGSPNVLRAVDFANSTGALTIGFTGNQKSARLLVDRCSLSLCAPLDCIEQIEDLHVVYSHIIALSLRARILSRR